MNKLYFDIGANIGKWSLVNSNDNKIIAVEASPSTFEKLQNNCKNTNIECLNYAVCDNDNKDIIFYDAKLDTLSTLNKDWLTNQKNRFYNITNYNEITCPTITLDKMIEKYGLPDLIKVDVEGGEFECIKSLTQKTKLLCFEWAAETHDISIKCLDYLTQLGYNQFYIQSNDDYTFRPNINDYYNSSKTKDILSRAINKVDWGMIWCK